MLVPEGVARQEVASQHQPAAMAYECPDASDVKRVNPAVYNYYVVALQVDVTEIRAMCYMRAADRRPNHGQQASVASDIQHQSGVARLS